MGNYTREEVLQMAEDEDVEFIRLQFTDMFGTLKNIAITARELPRALDNEYVVDSSYIAGIAGEKEPDMYLHPDYNTFTILPWRPQQGKVARLLCDIYRSDGTPLEKSPRYILKQVVEMAAKEGYVCEVDPDCVMTFKMAVRTIAKRHGLHATFMPKPRAEVNGSGMHIHFALYKDGKNIFADPDDVNGLSEDAYHFIGGLLAHSEEMAAITNPLVNSYKRLVPGYDAPTELTWTKNNQNSLIRISNLRSDSLAIELRSPDASANPYLVFAVCIAAGLDGIQQKLYPTKASDRSFSESDQKAMNIGNLPLNLDDALTHFENSPWIQSVLGKKFCEEYAAAKKEEWLNYMRQVSEWEISQYLYKI